MICTPGLSVLGMPILWLPHSLDVLPPGSHLLPQERSGIPALGLGNESMEQLEKWEKFQYLKQPSFHLGPQGHDVVLPKDEKVCHQEAPVLTAVCRLSKGLFAAGDARGC